MARGQVGDGDRSPVTNLGRGSTLARMVTVLPRPSTSPDLPGLVAMAGATLTIDFIGEITEVVEGQQLTFGRTADIAVDDANPYLHRIVGRFFSHAGAWWVENLGSAVALTLARADGTAVQLAPRIEGQPAPVSVIPHGSFSLRFEAGAGVYELVGRSTAAPVPPPRPSAVDGVDTVTFGAIPLTDEERALVIELVRPIFGDPAAGPDQLRPNREIATTLGWSTSKFNRKLDYLCARLARAGVRGMQGGRGAEASNRRWRLVEHAIRMRMITADDLDGTP